MTVIWYLYRYCSTGGFQTEGPEGCKGIWLEIFFYKIYIIMAVKFYVNVIFISFYSLINHDYCILLCLTIIYTKSYGMIFIVNIRIQIHLK